MHRFSFLAVALPALALAACTDSGNPGAVVAPLAPEAISTTAARGAQLAHDLCALCHGANFGGGTVSVDTELGGGTSGLVACPSLRVVLGYTLEDFDALLNTGLARDGEVVDPLMGEHWSLNAADRVALREYLISRFRDQ